MCCGVVVEGNVCDGEVVEEVCGGGVVEGNVCNEGVGKKTVVFWRG